jgi:hypothetical protein
MYYNFCATAGLSLPHQSSSKRWFARDRTADDLEQTDQVETCPDFDLHAHTPVGYGLFFMIINTRTCRHHFNSRAVQIACI